MKKIGLDHGDMVIFQSHQCRDFVDVFWACMYGGIVPVLATLPKSLSNIEAADSLTVHNIWKMLDKAKILVSDDVLDEYTQFANTIGIDTHSLINIKDLRNNDMAELTYKVAPDDISMMFFTSGSTGMPKGVIQTNRNAVTREYGYLQFDNIKKDIILNWMPLEHAGGVLMSHFRALMAHSRQIMVETDYILENPMRWLELIDKHRVNYSWAPHFAYVLLNDIIDDYQGDLDLSCINILDDGGEMVHAASGKEFLKKLSKFHLKGNVIQPAWGMCETCSGVIYNLNFNKGEDDGVVIVANDMSNGILTDDIEKGYYITAIGEPIPGCEMMIADNDNKPLNEDMIGRVLFRGQVVTKGYYKNEEVNKESFVQDNWFITGDLGFIHNGQMYLTGREKDIIIINGLNYNNVEIEAVIEEKGKVEKSFTAVCAIQDKETKKDIIVAFVVPRPGYDFDILRDEIISEVYDKIKLNITYVIPVSEETIPKTNLGKIQRAKLGKRFQNGDFSKLIGQDTDEAKTFENVEEKFREQLDVSDIVLMSKQSENETQYISTKGLHLEKNQEIVSNSDQTNINGTKVEKTLEKIEGIQKIIYSSIDNISIIYFDTSLKDSMFNVLIQRKIDEILLISFVTMKNYWKIMQIHQIR